MYQLAPVCQELPFNLTPSARFLYFTKAHRQALDHLLYGIQQRRGFIVLVGEVGAGKTTLCRAVLRDLDPSYKTALILNPMLSETQLLRLILQELGVADPRGDKLNLRRQLDDYLLDQAGQGHTVVLLIDEAQGLSRASLENIRLLSNLETETQKLLQIVLLGQPELRQTLNDHRLRQLRQRVTVYCYLGGMSREDTAAYIRHRLQVAGANGVPSFDSEALDMIYEHAEGIPRKINAVCDMALLAAYGRHLHVVGVAEVRSAADELQGVCQ